MALQTVLEKLQLKDEKNILIQGLPSSIEKQFIKLPFSKSVTPLLRSRKIDFALVFAISKVQLSDILNDVIPALHHEAKLWVAYPKPASKIASDLCRDCNWELVSSMGFETVGLISLDNTWSAIHFKRQEKLNQKKAVFCDATSVTVSNHTLHTIAIPEDLKSVFRKNKPAGVFFDSLSIINKKEYVQWVVDAKKMKPNRKESNQYWKNWLLVKEAPLLNDHL